MDLEKEIKKYANYVKTAQSILESINNPETVNTPEIRVAAGNLAHERNPEEFPEDYYMNEPAHVIYAGTQSTLKDSAKELTDLVINNFEDSLNLINEKHLESIILNTKPHESGNNKHKELAKQHKNFSSLYQKIMNNDLAPYLKGFALEMRKFMATEIEREPEKIKKIAQNYVALAKEKFISLFKEGKKYTNMAKEYIKVNYNSAKDKEKEGIALQVGLATN